MFNVQCSNSPCMQVKGSIQRGDSPKDFCEHMKKARAAYTNNMYAREEYISLKKILDKVSEEELEKAFNLESSDDEITVYHLPGKQMAVPMVTLDGEGRSNQSETFVHLKDLKCTLDSCTKKLKSKKHTLIVKGSLLCRHSLLGQMSVYLLDIVPS